MNLMQLRGRAKRLLPKSAFARGVSVLVGGTAGAQLMMVLAAPLLTRLYTPDDFGLLAVYSGILSIITVFCCLRYEIAIPMPKTDIGAYNVMALCLMVLSIITTIISIVICLFGDSILRASNMDVMGGYIWLIPVGVFLTGLYSIFNYWAIRRKKFKDMTLTKLHKSVVVLVIQVLFYKVGAGALVFGQAVGQGTGVLRLAKTIDIKKSMKTVSFRRIKRLALRYKNFPLFSTWTGIFNTVGNQLPPLIFAAVFSSSAAGLYALAHRIVSMPASIIGQSVANVFLSSAPQARREGKIDKLLFKVVLTLALLSFPAGVFLLVNAGFLFSMIFGESWRAAGIYAAVLVPMLLMGFVTSPVTTLCAVLDKQFAGTIFQFSMMTVRVVSISAGVYVADPMLALQLFSASSALCYLLFLLWLTSASGGGWLKMLGTLLQVSLLSMLVLAAVFGMALYGYELSDSALPILFVSGLSMFIVYILNYRLWRYRFET